MLCKNFPLPFCLSLTVPVLQLPVVVTWWFCGPQVGANGETLCNQTENAITNTKNLFDELVKLRQHLAKVLFVVISYRARFLYMYHQLKFTNGFHIHVHMSCSFFN